MSPQDSTTSTSGIPELNVRESFADALRVLNAEEGSVLALDLLQSLENEPFNSTGAQSKGVPQEFIDSLERVPLKNLPQKETADCPICTNRFVDDDYPLLVKLPCSVQHSAGKVAKDHIFDLECIGPWLKVNSTCPLCRFDVLEVDRKRRENLEDELKRAREEDEEEEEEGWDVYG